MENRYLSVAEAIKYLGISRSGLYERIADGTIVARKLGRRTLLAKADLDAALTLLGGKGEVDDPASGKNRCRN